MTSCLAFFVPNAYLTILSSIAIAGGLYFFFLGFHLHARKRSLLSTPTCKIHSAALGPAEVNGAAVGPYTIPAPITGKPSFLYRTTVWQQRHGKKQEWENIAEETLHLPFFIDDATGQLLIEPLGADLDLQPDFREEYDPSFFSSNLFSQNQDRHKDGSVPPRISVFLARHGIVPARRLRIEERSIRPEDRLFVTGTLTENPGVQLHPFSPHTEMRSNDAHTDVHDDNSRSHSQRDLAPNPLSERIPVPQIVRLQSGATPSTSYDMSQQGKIAAALTRAGITKPEAWSAAGVQRQTVAVEENTPPATAGDHSGIRVHEMRLQEDSTESSRFNLTPTVVMMKGANDSTFVISFRSQKALVSALAWKSAAMVWGGAAIALLGVCVLLAQMALL